MSDGKGIEGMITGTDTGFIGQPFPPKKPCKPACFVTFSLSDTMEKRDESRSRGTAHDLDIRSAEKPSLRFEYVVN